MAEPTEPTPRPTRRCLTLGGLLQSGFGAKGQRRQQQGHSPASATPPVQLWALALLRALLVKPHAQDALAKVTDGWTWLVGAQPVAQRLARVTGDASGGFALPWVVAWTSCLLDCAVSGVVDGRECWCWVLDAGAG